MKQILIDTNTYTAFIRGTPDAANVINHAPLIGVNAVVLGEILGGFAHGTRAKVNQQKLKQFLDTARVRVFTIDNITAEYYSQIYQNLRSLGKMVPTNDMWIAATAAQHNLAIFTYDKHFQNIKNITVGKTLTDFTR